MKSQWSDHPRIGVVSGGELSLSGEALLELMRAVLARSVPFRFRARGWSMDPFIRDGDVITISPLRGVLPRVGEVVAFAWSGTPSVVVHRVVGRRGTGSLIRGDGVPEYADGIIPPQNVLGRVTRVERNGHDIWLGLGPERIVIAWLSRFGLLVSLRRWLTRCLRPLVRR